MSKTFTRARLRPDGTVVEVLEDGSERPFPPDPPTPPMTEEEIEAAANSDPDARPMTKEEWSKARRLPRIRGLSRALRLTLEDFAARYLIPLETLKDWKEERSKPSLAMDAYLAVIACAAEFVQHVLHPEEAIMVAYPVHALVSHRCGLPMTVVTRLYPDGTLVQVLDSGSERPFPDRLPKRPPIQECEKNALPQANGHLRIEEEGQLDLKKLRCQLNLTREEFSSFYGFLPETLRDWEEGQASPDPGEQAYLQVIASAPNFVHRVLHDEVPADDLAPSGTKIARQNGAHPGEQPTELVRHFQHLEPV